MSDEQPHSRTSDSTHLTGTGTAVHETRDSHASDRLDLVFDLLRSPRRRFLLYYLFGMEAGGTSYSDAATAVANYEAASPDAPGSPSIETIRQELHHVQFPRLEAAGIVECDPRQQYVRFHGHEALGAWLQTARGAELD